MITETVSPEQIREQMDRLEEKLDRVLQYTHNLESRVEGLSEFKEDFVPIMNDAAKLASHKLMQMEAAGTLGALAGIGRSLAKPQLMEMVDRVLHAALNPPEAGAKTPGLLKSMRDPEVRRGMTVLLSVLRELGAGPSSPAPAGPALPPHAREP